MTKRYLAGAAILLSAGILAGWVNTPTSAAVGETPPIEWSKLKGPDGIEIEYQPGMEKLAERLIPEVQSRIKQYDEATARMKDARNLLSRNRDEFMEFLEEQLAVDGTDANWLNAKRTAASIISQISSQGGVSVPNSRHIRIWYAKTAQGMLAKGTMIPELGLNPSSGRVIPVYRVTMRVSSGEVSEAGGENACPAVVLIHTSDPNGAAAEAVKQLDGLLLWYDEITSVIAGTPLHEVAEYSLILGCGITLCPYRRWFCEGMANYLAVKGLEKFVGRSAAETFLGKHDSSSCQSYKDKVDLRYWRAEGWESNSPCRIDESTNDAAYAFALEEINGLVERHGPEVIPAIFKELAKTPRDKRDDMAILSAIQAATKEDFASVLECYGTKAPKDKLSRLAICGVCVVPFPWPFDGAIAVYDPKYQECKTKLLNDGQHGVQLLLVYAMPEPPATLKVDLAELGESGEEHVITTCTKTLGNRLDMGCTVVFKFPDDIGQLGKYRLKLYFEGQYYRDVDFEIVP